MVKITKNQEENIKNAKDKCPERNNCDQDCLRCAESCTKVKFRSIEKEDINA
jgi:hypothetical protein